MKFGIQIYFFISCVAPFVVTFSWHNCGGTSQPVKISSLDAFSNKTKTLYLSGELTMTTNITSPVKGVFDVQKKFFWGWTKIPCMDHLGSCTYEDLCKLNPFANRPCPTDYIEDDLPCRCPFVEGKYKLNKFPVKLNLLPHWAEAGKYRVKLSLNQKEKELICLLIYIDL